MGMLESGQTWSHEQLLIDNDIAKMVKRTVQGIDVNEETMAVELIKRAHEIKNFLHERHTIAHMREASRPDLIDRNTRGTWEEKGSKDMTQLAREKARQIIQTHQPDPIPDDIKKGMREMVEDARKKLVPA
jgi:trimethylamine--corrinoid protein Co-methyltransferase